MIYHITSLLFSGLRQVIKIDITILYIKYLVTSVQRRDVVRDNYVETMSAFLTIQPYIKVLYNKALKIAMFPLTC